MPSVLDYLLRITSEHNQKPKFVANVAASVRPFADMQVGILGMPQLYDLDNAVGTQLDTVGLWIGVSRNVSLDTMFSFDIFGDGFDQGFWDYPGSSLTAIDRLDDDQYRLLLRAQIVANTWDGSIPQAYAIWALLFTGTDYKIRLHDYQDMTMGMDLLCPPGGPDPVVRALFTQGYLDIKPEGVEMAARTVFALSVWDDGQSIWDGGASAWDSAEPQS